MNIPAKFTLAATEWKVKIVDDLPESLGQADVETQTILIRKSPNKQIMALTFCHELIHAFLYATGRNEDPHDELLVDGLSHYLHQYIQQSYED